MGVIATTVARLQAVLSADTRHFDSAMDRSQTRMGKVGHVAGIAGAAIAGALVVGLEKSVHAAMEGETAQARLEQAFKQSGESAGSFSGQIAKAEAANRKLGFTNVETRGSLGSLEVATHDHTKAIRDLGVATDIARFKNVDLGQATKMITMAMAGSQRATKQLGIQFTPTTAAVDALKEKYKQLGKEIPPVEMNTARFVDKQQNAQGVIDLVSKKLHGQAQAFAGTAQGGMAQFHAQTDALEESLGKGLLPAITDVAGVLVKFMAVLSQHQSVVKVAVAALGGLSAALLVTSGVSKLLGSTLVTRVIPQLWAMNAALLANPIGIVVVALAALGIAFAIAWRKSETFRAVVTAAWNGIKAAAGAVAGFFQNTVWPLIGTAIDLIQKHPAWIAIKFAIQHIDDVTRALISAFQWIRDNGSVAIGTFWAKVQKPLGLVKDAFHLFADAIDKIVGGIRWLIDNAGKVGGFFGKLASNVPHGDGVVGPVSGGTGPKDISSTLWDDLNLAGTDGLILTSGYRPGAITSTGNVSLHSLYPSKAIDVSGSESAMKQFFWQEVSRGASTGLREIIHSPLWWHPGVGVSQIPASAGSVLADHYNHVHVGSFDRGGWLKPGLTLAYNGTGRPEPVGGGMPDRLYLDLGELGIVELVRREKARFERLNGPGSF